MSLERYFEDMESQLATWNTLLSIWNPNRSPQWSNMKLTYIINKEHKGKMIDHITNQTQICRQTDIQSSKQARTLQPLPGI